MGLQASNRFDGGETNKPDIVVMEKKEGKCLVIDIARPFNTRISEDWKSTLDLNRGSSKGFGSVRKMSWHPWNGVNQPKEMVIGA